MNIWKQASLLWVCGTSLACRPAGTDSDKGPRDSFTDSRVETGQDSDDSRVDTVDTGEPVVEGIQLLDLEQEGFSDWGYEMATYGVVDGEYHALDGQPPLFHVVRPVSAPEGPIPLLVWFHGGHIGNDVGGAVPENCERSSIDSNIEMVLGEASLVTEFLARRGWALFLPRNDWCDGGFGQGGEDPVDPVNHWGHHHYVRTLEWILAGHAGVDGTGPRYGWGTSAGGAWSVFAAQHHGGFEGLVIDSAACDQLLMYGQDPGSTEHMFGGPPEDAEGNPTEAQARYLAASCTSAFAGQGLDVPTFVAWNNQDLVIPTNQPSQLVSVLGDASNISGLRNGSHDFHHLAPSPNNHVQTRLRNLPWGYTTEAMFSFLEGKRVIWREAEAGCSPGACAVGAVVSEDPEWANYSGGGAIRALASEGPGKMFEVPLPLGLSTEESAEMVAVVEAFGLEGVQPGIEVLTLAFTVGTERTEVHLAANEFAPQSQASDEELLNQYMGTRLSFTPQQGGVLSVRSRGVADLVLDALILTSP